jgi:hypothetical protein
MAERSIPAAFAAFVLALAPARGSAQEQQTDEARADTRAIRLAERLDGARIEGPLVGLAPADDLDDLEDPARDVLLDEGFEEFDWDFAGWPQVPGVAIVAGGSGGDGHALELAEPTRASLGWVLPVRPDSFYRFVRALRTADGRFCDVVVV